MGCAIRGVSLPSWSRIFLGSSSAPAFGTKPSRGEGSVLLTGGGFGVYPIGNFLSLSIGKAPIRAMEAVEWGIAFIAQSSPQQACSKRDAQLVPQ